MFETMRSSLELDERRKRLLFRAWHRGMREMDMLMGSFANAVIQNLSENELLQFEALIDVPDRDLFQWITDELETPVNFNTPLFQSLKHFHTHNEPLYSKPLNSHPLNSDILPS